MLQKWLELRQILAVTTLIVVYLFTAEHYIYYLGFMTATSTFFRKVNIPRRRRKYFISFMAIKIFDQIEMCNSSILMVAISMKMIFLLVFISQSFIIKSQIQRMILCTFVPFSLLTTIGYRLSIVQIFVGMPSRGFVNLQYLRILKVPYLIRCSTPIADVDSIWK